MKKLPLLILLLFALNCKSQVYNYYFGNLHSHTGYSDGNDDGNSPTPATAFTYGKLSSHFNFLGVSEHNHNESTNMSLSNWSGLKTQTAAANDDGTFVCMYGMEYGTISAGGHFLIYGFDSLIGWNPGAFQVFVAKGDYASLYPIVKNHPGAFALLAHPVATDYDGFFSAAYNSIWDDAVVGTAIRNGPSTSTNTTYSNPSTSSFNSRYTDALKRGYHVAPSIDHDNHNTTFGRTTMGRTVVLATSLTQANIMDAYRNMRFYASDDWNCKVDYKIGTKVMGSITTRAGVPTISISITDDDLETIASITLLSALYSTTAGVAPTTMTSNSNSSTLTYTDNSLANGTTRYYYAKIVQTDGDEIWTAPIWYTRNDAVLPIELSFFNAQTLDNKIIELNWSTASEINNQLFEIERSEDGSTFHKIGEQKGAINSKDIKNYIFRDENAGFGIHYYRLKQIDINGSFEYSKVVSAVKKNKDLKFIHSSYQENELKINLFSPVASAMELSMTDLSGKIIFNKSVEITEGNNALSIPLELLAKGVYTITVKSTLGNVVEKILIN